MIDTSVEKSPKTTAAKRWSTEEEARLGKAYLADTPLEDIANAHGRSVSAIESRLRRLDLIHYGPYTELADLPRLPESDETPPNNGKPWTEEEMARLRTMHESTPTPEGLLALAGELGRSPRSLVLKLINSGLVTPSRNPNPQPKDAPAPPRKKGKITPPEAPSRTLRVTITPEFQTGLRAVEEGRNLLVLGSAGTGKSTFLKWVRKKIGESKTHVVLAPTGMAALQVGGQTIHSFFGFKPQLITGSGDWRKPRNPKMYEALELIILDEISMVRADVFEGMDNFLRRHGPRKGEPFGGVQILALGDLFQLPPIVRREEADTFNTLFPTPFFFGSPAWQAGAFNVLEFTHIFRQSDAPFIDLLNRVRHGEKTGDLLAALNQRLNEHPPADAVILAARNRTVDDINQRELEKLAAPAHLYTAKTSGKVDENAFNSPVELVLKSGARVMFTRNDPAGRWVNGTLGRVEECGEDKVVVRTDENRCHTVEPVKWELVKYTLDAETEALVTTVAGTFSQLPLTLAWALTIHKAQGQTLENCVLDLSDGGAFAEGQLYVALSRARSLEALHLARPVAAADIRTSAEVKRFHAALRGDTACSA